MALGESGAHRLRGRRGRVAVADVDLDLAAPQAGGDLDLGQGDPLPLHLAHALGDLRLGDAEHAQRVAVQGRRPSEQLAERLGRQRRRPHRLQLARRAGQDDDEAPVRGHHQTGRGADRVEGDRALGDHGLLAVGLAQRLRVEVEAPAELAQDRGDLLLDLLVEHHLAAGEAPDQLGGEVVGGRPEAAGGDDQVHPLPRHEAQRRPEVLGAVADDEDVGDLDPELGQPFGEPGTVAIGDPPGQHLGPGDDYSSTQSHPRTRKRMPVHI